MADADSNEIGKEERRKKLREALRRRRQERQGGQSVDSAEPAAPSSEGSVLQALRARRGSNQPRRAKKKAPSRASQPQPASEELQGPPADRTGGRLSQQFRQRFEELIAEGVDRPTAFRRAIQEQQQFEGPLEERQTTPAESALTGATSGFGFADEIFGALDAAASVVTPFSATGVRDPEASVLEEFRRTRDAFQQQEKGAEVNPKSLLAGKIIEGVAGGAALGSAAGVARAAPPAAKAAKSVGGVRGALQSAARSAPAKATALGAAEGAVIGVGESDADLTQGEFEDVLVDAGTGALFGTAGAAAPFIGKGVIKIGGALARRTPWIRTSSIGASSAARKTALEAGEEGAETAAIGFRESVDDFTKRSDELIEWLDGELPEGEDFVGFTAAQRTGSPAAAARETAERQAGGTVGNRAQRKLSKQMDQSSRALESAVNKVAADPANLGKKDVGTEITDSILGYADSLIAKRSSKASKAFGRAHELADGERVIPINNFKAALKELSQEASEEGLPDAEVAKGEAVQRILGRIEDIEAWTPAQMQKNLKVWGKGAQGSGKPFKDLEQADGKRVARTLFGALQQDLDDAIASGGRAAEALKSARDIYRVTSLELDNVGIDAVKKILNIEGRGAPDKITKALLSEGTSDDQVRAVFEIIETASPEAARNARAQLIEDVLVQGSKPSRGARLARAKGAVLMNPLAVLNRLAKKEETLMAAFGDDKFAREQFENILDTVQRLAGTQRQGLEGRRSQTASVLSEFGRMANEAAQGRGGEVLSKAWKLMSAIWSDEKAFARAASEGTGLKATNKMLEALERNKQVSDEVAGAFIGAMSRLGVNELVEQPEARVTEAGRNLGQAERERAGQFGGRR